MHRPNNPVHKIFRKINISYPLIRPSTFSILNFVFCERLRSISSSRSQMFFKISHALKNFAIFTGKHLCWSIFLINLVSQESCNFIKERLQHRYFLWIYEIFKSIFLIEHFQWLVPENDFLNILQNTVSRILIYIFKFAVGFFPLRGGENERTFLINPFHATSLLRYPLKTWKNQRFSDAFRGYRKRPVAWNKLIECHGNLK